VNKQEALKSAEDSIGLARTAGTGYLPAYYLARAQVYSTLAIALKEEPVPNSVPPVRKFSGPGDDEYNQGYEQGLYDGAHDLAKLIDNYTNDPYKPYEAKIQLIRESCGYVLEVEK
jgi:hypothetical protein